MKKIYWILIFILIVILLPFMKSVNTTEITSMSDIKKADSLFNIVGIKGYTVSNFKTEKSGQIYFEQQKTTGTKRKKTTKEYHRFGVYKNTISDGSFYTLYDLAKYKGEYVLFIEKFSDYNSSTKTTISRPDTVTDEDYIVQTGSISKLVLYNMLVNGCVFAILSFVVYVVTDKKKK